MDNLLKTRSTKLALFISVLVFVPLDLTLADPTLMWLRDIENPRDVFVSSACATADGGIVVAVALTASEPGSHLDALLYKYDGRGQLLWQKEYGSGERVIYEVKTLPDDALITFGSTNGAAWVQKLDMNGNVHWDHQNGLAIDKGTISSTSDGGYVYTAVYRDPYHVRTELALVKLGSAGQMAWSHVYHFDSLLSSCEPGGILETHDHGYLATGAIARIDDNSRSRMVLVRTDSLGSLLWSLDLGDSLASRSGGGIYEFSAGQYIVSGTYSMDNSPGIRYLVRLTDEGDTLWSTTSPVLGVAIVYYEEGVDSSLLGVVGIPEIDWENGTITKSVYVYRADWDGSIRWRNQVIWQYGEWFDPYGLSFTCDSSFVIPFNVRWGKGAVALVSSEHEPHDCGPLPLVQIVAVDPAYPNPFNAASNFTIWLSKPAWTSFAVFDILGRQVDTIHEGFLPLGESTIRYTPISLSTGMYFCRFEALGQSSVQRIILLR